MNYNKKLIIILNNNIIIKIACSVALIFCKDMLEKHALPAGQTRRKYICSFYFLLLLLFINYSLLFKKMNMRIIKMFTNKPSKFQNSVYNH